MQTKLLFFSWLGIVAVFAGGCAHGPVVAYVSLHAGESGRPNPVQTDRGTPVRGGPAKTVEIFPEQLRQELDGVGGAFNEIGGEALAALPASSQHELLQHLFSPVAGAGLSLCRTAIGASDFAFDAYSYSEVPDDYSQENFSIKRDEKFLLPFIRAARAENPGLKLFASPWSPPGWMKRSGHMEQGVENPATNHLRDEPRIYQAYALYLAKYAEAYAAQGAPLDRIVIQNETDIDTKYPSCWMEPTQMAEFAGHYLRPVFQSKNLSTKIWAGTFRAKKRNHALAFVELPGAIDSVDGIGFQYSLPSLIEQVHATAPRLPLMHTEGACFNGANSMDQAIERFEEIVRYFNAGLRNYCYWNMILNETGRSGWDWRQNCLVTVNRQTGGVIYNPDYLPVYMFSKFIPPGSRRVAARGDVPVLAVKSTEGIILFLQNRAASPQNYVTKMGAKTEQFSLPAHAICAVILRLN